jgi:hypothetical protein
VPPPKNYDDLAKFEAAVNKMDGVNLVSDSPHDFSSDRNFAPLDPQPVSKVAKGKRDLEARNCEEEEEEKPKVKIIDRKLAAARNSYRRNMGLYKAAGIEAPVAFWGMLAGMAGSAAMNLIKDAITNEDVRKSVKSRIKHAVQAYRSTTGNKFKKISSALGSAITNQPKKVSDAIVSLKTGKKIRKSFNALLPLVRKSDVSAVKRMINLLKRHPGLKPRGNVKKILQTLGNYMGGPLLEPQEIVQSDRIIEIPEEPIVASDVYDDSAEAENSPQPDLEEQALVNEVTEEIKNDGRDINLYT